ncbi:MAG: class II aldolase/adducin family protein, partial [Bacteroidales bacterium]|nr:class II aldolase/adducin family protein [Bacteroidales bacterium]
MTVIENLVAISRKYGADARYVIAGGGNTSYKDAEKLWVKASGHALATIDEDGFAVLDRSKLNPMGEKAYSADVAAREAQVKEDLAAACLTQGRRPSVETSLHNCMGFAYVVHLHPTLVNGLMCSVKAAETCAELFPDALYIEYTDPGYTLFKKVYDRIQAWKATRGSEPQVIFLQNHGVFVGADSTEEIDRIYGGIMDRLEARVKPVPDGVGEKVPVEVTEILPAIRQILSRGGRGLKTLQVTRNALVDRFLENPEPVLLPFTPDIIVYCKSEYVVLDSEDLVKEAEEKIEAYVARRGHTPKVLLVKGIGLVAVGDHAKNAGIITEVFLDAMKVAFYAGSFGGE